MEWKLNVELWVKNRETNKNIVDVETSNYMITDDDFSEDYVKQSFEEVLNNLIQLVHDTNSGVIKSGFGGFEYGSK